MATIDELRALAREIREERQIGGNTGARVGNTFDKVADLLESTGGDISDIREAVEQLLQDVGFIPRDISRTTTDAGFTNSEGELLFWLSAATDTLAGLITAANNNKLIALPTAEELAQALAEKQNRLTFDPRPIEGSTNPVTSDGINTAIANFVTRSVSDLIYYYTKSETYTKEEVNALVAAIKQFVPVVAQTLPTASADTMYKLYLVPSEDPQEGNIKDEYITIDNGASANPRYTWEKIGSVDIDISGKADIGTVPADVTRTASDATFVNNNHDPLFYLRQATSSLAGLMTSAEHNKLGALPTAQDLNTRLESIIYDVSANHPTAGPNNDGKFTLAYILNPSNVNTLIPTAVRKGGMSIKFVQSSDNKYVQYRCVADEFSINENDWEQAASVEQVSRISSAIELTKILLPNGSQKSKIPTTSILMNGGGYKAYDYDVENINYIDIYSNINAETAPDYNTAVLWALYDTDPATNPQLLAYGPFLSTGEQHGKCDLSLYPSRKILRVVTDTLLATPVTEVSYLTTNYVKHSEIEDVVRTTDIVDNLLSSQNDKPLSASQGKILNGKLFTETSISPTGDVKSTIPKSDGSTMSGGSYGALVYNVQDINSVIHYQTDASIPTNPELMSCVVWALYNSTTHNASNMVAVGQSLSSSGRSGDIDLSLYPTAVSLRITCNKATAVVSVVEPVEKYATKDELSEVESELRKEIGNAGGNKIDVLLPNKIHAVNGDRLQIFYRSVLNTLNDSIYNIKALCTEGKAYPRYLHFEATQSLVGTSKTLQILAESPDGTVKSQKSVPILTINKPTSPASNKNILVFGDSILGSGSVVNELRRRLVETSGTTDDRANPKGLGLSNVTFVGRKRGSAYDVPQEATGGWSWAEYATRGRQAYRFNVSGVVQLHIGDVYSDGSHSYTIAEINVTDGSGNIRCFGSSNPSSLSGTLTLSSGSGDSTISYSSYVSEYYSPFYDITNNTIDFVNYANEYCNGAIDIIVSFCGINDIFSAEITSIATKFETYIKPFIRKYHTQFPNGKFILSTLQLPDMNGGLGASYGAVQTANWWSRAQNFYEFARLAYELEADSEFSSYVTVANVITLFDTEHLYSYNNNAVCNRLSSVKEEIGTNGVHPSGSGGAFVIGDSEAGTKTIADALYYAVCANL